MLIHKWAYGNLLLYSAGLTHQKCFAQVTTGLLRNLLGQLGRKEQTLFFTNSCQNTTDLINREMEIRCCHLITLSFIKSTASGLFLN